MRPPAPCRPRQRRLKIRPQGEFPEGGSIPPEDVDLPWGPTQSLLCVGAQVRVPIGELKAWLEEKLAY